ncbi:coniferyl aldehyde dehydrogenase [Legionella waltersii]|uniref:Aldehyde dehydrogenase n=1 Tax=Legionella waltersii TaxID=66969 RepID=A0A0W1ALV6_9GAMM|nr:coniferyl aldehyde dehydrogenase [Legionella waltersii]KTD82319.1 alcohol dehydrogenase [Legionella waltersii]SNV04065.1 alcohol dehydrogenase [Legionella waltersii]
MDLQTTFTELQKNFQSAPYPSLAERKQRLSKLKTLLQEKALVLSEAINSDFTHRSTEETLFLELFPIIKAIDYCLKHTKGWMKKKRKSVSWLLFPAKAYVFPQPLGVIGIMVPWNYPVYLSLVPAIYAIAAGNKVMIKMSELSTHIGETLSQLIQSIHLQSEIAIINGDVSVSREFSSLPFAHILFTGSTQVGKLVMKAASENLTPVTLELGGKSPAIISKSMNKRYFKRLFMGKLFNAAQTCIAPDYLLIPKGWESKIEDELRGFIHKSYPELMSNKNYSSIISSHHKQRLLDMLEDARTKGARIVEFGELSSETRKLPLYLLFNVSKEMRVMQEEIFGPILPVLSYQSFQEAIDYINSEPNPLALYYFGENKKEQQIIKTLTLSGAFTINDTIMHIAVDDLPFGGVGNSGMGHYHGQEGFNAFSKLKPIFVQRFISTVSWLYPPYGTLMRSFLSWIGGIKLRGDEFNRH